MSKPWAEFAHQGQSLLACPKTQVATTSSSWFYFLDIVYALLIIYSLISISGLASHPFGS